MVERTGEVRNGSSPGWFSAFLRELMSMLQRHVVVFVIATILLVFLEVELTEGWT